MRSDTENMNKGKSLRSLRFRLVICANRWGIIVPAPQSCCEDEQDKPHELGDTVPGLW